MSINLKKGQKIVLGHTNVTIGLGWKPNENGGDEYDLDCSAFMLGADGKLLSDEYFVFYGNLTSPDKAVKHMGDDRTGGNSEDGDDEEIIIDVTKINPNVAEILFVVSIYEATERNQNFGQVRKSYIRLVDNNTNTEIAKYDLDEDFSIETIVEFGRLYKYNNEWKFDAIGIGQRKDLRFYTDKYSK